MMKGKRTKKRKGLAIALAVLLAAGTLSPLTPPVTVEAASTVTSQNLLVNADMEGETDLPSGGYGVGSQTGNWHVYPSSTAVSVVGDESHDGSQSVKMSPVNSSLEQDVKGLQNGATYTFSIWAKADNASGGDLRIGVKGYGGSEKQIKVDSNDWKKYELTFVATSGLVRCYAWMAANSAGGNFYLDDASLTVESDLEQVSVSNGTVEVAFKEGTDASKMSKDNFEVTYESSLAPGNLQSAEITESKLNGNVLTMQFAEIDKEPIAQTITMYVEYTPSGQRLTLDFEIAASGEDVVVAKIKTMKVDNGKITATLDKVPTVKPAAEDFLFSYKLDGEEAYQELLTKNFVYDEEKNEVTAEFNKMAANPEKDQKISVKAVYNDVETVESFTIAKTDGVIYYVSEDGDDANDGLSEDKPIRTIERVNEILFNPGDQLLFKKGDEFKGALEPKGSGIEGYPIVIASYGDGDKKPVLRPGDENKTTYVMSADTYETHQVNNCISFYNQEYWEVKDLELFGPEMDSPKVVYRRGINIAGEDYGEMNHFHFDNLTIHSFWGPNTNLGKSSGGILMEVVATPNTPASEHTPTSINDIRIENCELYDLGRSGINFVSVWGKKTDATDTKWGAGYPSSHGANRVGYTRMPYKDFYLGNNEIYDIQGDGCIVDTCDDAVVEKNLVYRCCKNTTEAATMAVGLFNWNSVNTMFQYNEVYDTFGGGDGQGIEIDALNDKTLVQYNYLHDNKGGSMMWCTTNTLYSFDGIYRYNIFENDGVLHGMIDYRVGNYGAKAYNNTYYIAEDALKNGKISVFGYAGSDPGEFYNNIFYYSGEAKEADNFNNGAIDWRNNIFYNFLNLPDNDDPSAPNISADPKFVNPGSGETGTVPGTRGNVDGYMLQEDSPAINAGYAIEDNGGLDYFGNEVSGIPDIGAYESGSIGLKVTSDEVSVSQDAYTIGILEGTQYTAEALLEALVYDKGVQVQLLRDGRILPDYAVVKAGDVVEVFHNGETVTYTVEEVENPEGEYIPTEHMTATAGSEQSTSGKEGPAANVLDGSSGTLWHSSWSGAERDDLYLTLELDDIYTVTGLQQLPRSGGGRNGIITKYRIETSMDGESFEPAAEGTWTETGWQIVEFGEAVEAKYVRLYAVESVSQEATKQFASAAEIRLTGERKDAPTIDTEAPGAPGNVTASYIGKNNAEISWDASKDNEGVVKYAYYLNNQYCGELSGEITDLEIQDLEKGTEYTVSVYAYDAAGNESDAGSVTFTTKGDAEEPKPVDKTELKKFYEQCLAYYKAENHSKDNWNKYQSILKDVEAVLEDENATEDDVNRVLKELIQMSKVLKQELEDAKEESKDPSKPGKPGDTPKTGDSSAWGFYAALILISGIAILYVKRRKRLSE